MINTDYSIYGQYLKAANTGRTKGMDKSHLSKNMEYLERAMAKTKEAKGAAQKENAADSGKKGDRKEVTQEDIRKLYAELNGTNYESYDGKESYRSMANSFLDQMVFSNMGSSRDLFVPQISRNVISAAFRAVYDSDVEEKIRNMKIWNEAEEEDEKDGK